MAERRQKPSKSAGAVSETSDALGRPEVVVEFLFDRGMLFISVRNIGGRPATNVAVKFDKRIIGLGGTKEISALALFRNIEFLGPAREIVTLVDTSGSYFQRKQPTKVSARISYLDLERQKYETTVKHDLEIYRELSYVVSPATSESSSSCDS
jgi:methionyl-tRNA synthetase